MGSMPLLTKYKGRQPKYRGVNWREARLAALEIYGWRCVTCQTDLKAIPRGYVVHHHVPFKAFLIEEVANATDNLRPMCKSCHAKEERLGKTTTGRVVRQG